MAKVEALTSFAGTVTMAKGEVKDIDDALAERLAKAKYVKIMKEEKKQNGNRKNTNTKAVHDS